MFHILFQERERSNRRIYFQVQISGTMLKVKYKSIAKESMLASNIVEYVLFWVLHVIKLLYLLKNELLFLHSDVDLH